MVHWKPRVPDLPPNVRAPRLTTLSARENWVPVSRVGFYLAHWELPSPGLVPNQQIWGPAIGVARAGADSNNEPEPATKAAEIKSLARLEGRASVGP